MHPVIYFRGSLAEQGERDAAERHFQVIDQRTLISAANHDVVIPRYSALPYYEELEADVKAMGADLLNTYKEHRYVANISSWYADLEDVTPRTWFHLDQIPEKGPFVLKGETNSKKFSWNTHMFAGDRRAAVQVYANLAADSMIGVQDICIREYVPLRKLDEAPQGLPISEEYRFFVLDGKVLTGAFYWGNYREDLIERGIFPNVADVPDDFIQKIIDVVSPNIRFFVFDVARTESGDWILIELNDGQQSGLSMNDPDVLYYRMRRHLKKHGTRNR